MKIFKSAKYKEAVLQESGYWNWRMNWQEHIANAIVATFPLISSKESNPSIIKRTSDPKGFVPQGVSTGNDEFSSVQAYLKNGEYNYWLTIFPREGWTFVVEGNRKKVALDKNTNGVVFTNAKNLKWSGTPLKTPSEVVKAIEQIILNDKDDFDNDNEPEIDPLPTPHEFAPNDLMVA